MSKIIRITCSTGSLFTSELNPGSWSGWVWGAS